MFCPLDGTRLLSPSMGISSPATAVDPLIGTVVSARYKILHRIGEGGMGIVYEAEHVVIEKRVALKVLRDDFSRRPELVERFRQEARSASRIGHDNIVDISDFGETPSGANYFVMEMLHGEDLAMVLQREGSLDPEFAAHVVLQCCKGLGAAHAKGIVHRDMKPENIFLIERDGRKDFVKLVDFGIAKMSDVETPGAPGRKLTKTGMIFGTPEYMSPEQAAGKALDHRVDIYAMGIILYELLTGRVPFVGDTFMGILTQHMFEEPPTLHAANPRVQISPILEDVVIKALAKGPAQRFQTMHEMAVAIQTAMGMDMAITESSGRYSYGGPGTGSSHSRGRISRITSGHHALADTTYMPRARASLKGWRLAIGALALLVLGGLGWMLGTTSVKAPEKRSFAQEIPAAPSAAETKADPKAIKKVPVAEIKQPEPLVAAKTVTLHVTTQPPGAELVVEGRGVVCTTTPCTFETARGEMLTMHATRDNSVASHKLTPNENSFVAMQLRNLSRRSVAHGRRDRHKVEENDKGSSPKPALEPVVPPPRSSGDLKIPDIFR